MTDLEYINDVISDIDLDKEYIETTFNNKNIKVLEVIDGNEDRECSSVTWDDTYIVEYNNKKYSCYISGTAIAEISYERWTDTFGYNIEDYNVEEIKDHYILRKYN